MIKGAQWKLLNQWLRSQPSPGEFIGGKIKQEGWK